MLAQLEECFCFEAANCATLQRRLPCRYRAAFSSSCLQRTRFQATLLAWETTLNEELDGEVEHPIQWGAWHARIAAYVKTVDWPSWSVPEEQRCPQGYAVCRDAEVLLPWVRAQGPGVVDGYLCV